jgi:uncharacterized protein YndB with AHSA1/START domain
MPDRRLPVAVLPGDPSNARRFYRRLTIGAMVWTLRLERVLPVPPARVFGAFTDPEQLRQWFGPVGYTVRSLDFEVVEGEGYRLAMQPPAGDAFHIRGTFRAVEAPSRLVFTFAYEEPDPHDRETVVTLTLTAAGSGTQLVLEQAPFMTEARLRLHRDGWTDTLERLERSLA